MFNRLPKGDGGGTVVPLLLSEVQASIWRHAGVMKARAIKGRVPKTDKRMYSVPSAGSHSKKLITLIAVALIIGAYLVFDLGRFLDLEYLQQQRQAQQYQLL